MQTKKQREARERNWTIYQLTGYVMGLNSMTTNSRLTAEEQNEAAQLRLDLARFLEKLRNAKA